MSDVNPFAVELESRTNPFAAELEARTPNALKARASDFAVPFGLADETHGAAAAIKAFTDNIGQGFDAASAAAGAAYNERSAQMHQAMEAYRSENPATALGSEIAGGGAVGKIGGFVGKLPAWLQSTTLGGLFGAAYGAGNAEGGIGERAQAAAVGAPIGAATGMGLHGLIRGAGAVVGPVAKGIQTLRDPQGAAFRKLGEAAALDETTPGRMAARLKELGPQATLADVGGENVLGLARGASGVPGPAKNRAAMMLESRATGEGERIGKTIAKTLHPTDYFAAEDQFLAKLGENAKATYTAAYEANPSVMTPRLEKMLENPRVRAGIKEAATMAADIRASGQSKWLGPVDQELTELARFAAEVGKGVRPESPGVAKGFSLETWQHVKEGLDSLLKSKAYANEVTGKLNPKGYAVNELKQALVRELDRATGGESSLYKVARQQYGGDIEVVKALREGREFMRLAPEQIAKQISGYSEAAQEAYRSGAARAIKDIVDRTVDTASASRALFAKGINRGRIKAIFPDPKSYGEFARTMTAEQRFQKTYNAIGSGSRTAPMVAEIGDASNAVGNIGAIIGANIPGANNFVAAGIGRRMAQKFFPQNQEMNQALSRMMFNRNQPNNQFVLDRLRQGNIGAPGTPSTDAMIRILTQLAGQQEGRLFGQSQSP